MGNTRENRFTVHQRLAASEARLTALEQENAALRAWVSGTVASQINDAKNTIQSAQSADFRDLQVGIGKAFSDLKASVKNGVDGKDGAPGPQGPRGDVLIPNESEAQAALKAARLKLAQRHAAQIAPIVRRLEFERTKNLATCTDSGTLRHFSMVLRDIQEEISRLEPS
jgi:hypothetical protein